MSSQLILLYIQQSNKIVNLYKEQQRPQLLQLWQILQYLQQDLTLDTISYVVCCSMVTTTL